MSMLGGYSAPAPRMVNEYASDNSGRVVGQVPAPYSNIYAVQEGGGLADQSGSWYEVGPERPSSLGPAPPKDQPSDSGTTDQPSDSGGGGGSDGAGAYVPAPAGPASKSLTVPPSTQQNAATTPYPNTGGMGVGYQQSLAEERKRLQGA